MAYFFKSHSFIVEKKKNIKYLRNFFFLLAFTYEFSIPFESSLGLEASWDRTPDLWVENLVVVVYTLYWLFERTNFSAEYENTCLSFSISKLYQQFNFYSVS